MRLLSRIALTSAFVFAAASGMAATLDLTGATGAALAAGWHGSAIYSDAAFGAVTFTANPAGSDLTYSAGSGLGIDCEGSGSLACRVDNRNQVDNGEVLSVGFEQSLFVTSVDMRNLLGTNLRIGRYTIHIADEGGSVVGSDFVIDFSSTDASTTGALNLSINRWASSISFVPNDGFLNAFSVAGISIDEFARPLPAPGSNPIPEPSSVLLMVAGGAFVANQVRKRA